MSNCLQCGKHIIQKNGGKERKFCDNNNACKQAYFNKNKKKPKYVRIETFQELQDKFNALSKERDNPFQNAARGRDSNGVNNDEVREKISIDNSGLLKQIEAIKKETMPNYITTPMGKKSWLFDQSKKIKEIESKIIG